MIKATKAEETATFTVQDHGDVADPGTDHGTSGEEEETFAYTTSFDFTRNRALVRWQFPAGFDGEPTDVEVRTIDGTSYVRDGSWLCPACGFDDSDPPALPTDKWITLEEGAGDVAFDFVGGGLHAGLGWLKFVDEAVDPGARSELGDGSTVVSYRAEVPVSEVNAAVKAANPADEYAPVYQGDNVTISFKVDSAGRLRELVVEYHVDDRARTLTAILDEFGTPVDIEIPPPDEIYRYE